MSRTDKTTPWRVVESRGDCDAARAGYPCRHFSSYDALKVLKRRDERRARTRLRADLAHGVEPTPWRHRHNALWDLS